ncbi:hypothetical protein C6P40_002104 [Pichia californica]|uniref:CID domain-containing protein n=1 Tax=Pichia californica TaxID=460514 RepID=A0A9P6WI89_9ASCO|nr:hypothetical protein C6P42_002155 [[Candida] californica]KAG0687610.1 hypothetical protein C6P40_002104 [[Candida] californica]
MDSFELQLQLSGHLSGLNSSKQSSIELCNFLIRNYVNQEDLYPILIQTLPKLDINKRLNFFQFIDDFLTLIKTDTKLKNNDIIYNYAFLIVSDLNIFLQYILPKTPIELIKSNQLKRSEIRTLSNLHFCYTILIHISKLFDFKDLNNLELKYNSNLLSDIDIDNLKNSAFFDESELYNTNAQPTKSSHVDDYMNSKNQKNNIKKIQEEKYIPEQINQGLLFAWKFLIGKRKQSQYESLLIDYNNDPFNSKNIDNQQQQHQHQHQQQQALYQTNTQSVSINQNSSAVNSNTSPPRISTDEALEITNINNTDINTIKTPIKHSIQHSPLKSNTNSHVLALTQNSILQRMEADRERQKRGKETLWEVERPKGIIQKSEFEYIYDTLQSFNEVEDKPIIDEMNNLYQLCLFKKTNNNNNTNNSNSNNKRKENKFTANNNNKSKLKSNTRPNSRYSSKPNDRPRKYDTHDKADLFHPENFRGDDNANFKRQRTENINRSKYPNDYYNNYYNNYDYNYDYDYDYEYQQNWHYKNGGNNKRRNGENNGNYGRRR